uniref:Uncharacterized protein n=1 Tax=Brassica oleracea var. oleracea TaxID=109376 RepID=A0A0D3BGW2_BRAOL
MSDHASPTARVIPSDLSVHADHNFPLDCADQTVRTDPSDHPDRTARAVHRIDPQTSVLELSLEPRPIDGFDQPTSLLSQPIQHSKTDSQARFNLGREESEDVHRFSLMALLVHPACPEGCHDVLASVPDPLMNFSHSYFTKAWKLSCLKTCLTPVHILVMKINRRERLDTRRKDHIKTTRDVADPKRRLLLFDVQDICDNLEKGMMKALKDISKNHKKSTSTRAPVAEPSLFISEKPKELTVLQPEHPSCLVFSQQVFEEEPLDFPHQGPCLDTRNPSDEDLAPIFDEEDEHGPVFDEEATSITSIVMESHLCFDPDTIPAP